MRGDLGTNSATPIHPLGMVLSLNQGKAGIAVAAWIGNLGQEFYQISQFPHQISQFPHHLLFPNPFIHHYLALQPIQQLLVPPKTDFAQNFLTWVTRFFLDALLKIRFFKGFFPARSATRPAKIQIKANFTPLTFLCKGFLTLQGGTKLDGIVLYRIRRNGWNLLLTQTLNFPRIIFFFLAQGIFPNLKQREEKLGSHIGDLGLFLLTAWQRE